MSKKFLSFLLLYCTLLNAVNSPPIKRKNKPSKGKNKLLAATFAPSASGLAKGQTFFQRKGTDVIALQQQIQALKKQNYELKKQNYTLQGLLSILQKENGELHHKIQKSTVESTCLSITEPPEESGRRSKRRHSISQIIFLKTSKGK